MICEDASWLVWCVVLSSRSPAAAGSGEGGDVPTAAPSRGGLFRVNPPHLPSSAPRASTEHSGAEQQQRGSSGREIYRESRAYYCVWREREGERETEITKRSERREHEEPCRCRSWYRHDGAHFDHRVLHVHYHHNNTNNDTRRQLWQQQQQQQVYSYRT